jgi:hypothetical protein
LTDIARQVSKSPDESSIEGKSEEKWKYNETVPTAEIIQEIKKLQHKPNKQNSAFLLQNFESSKKRTRWDRNLGKDTIDALKPVPKVLKLFVVLLPPNNIMHSNIQAKLINLKSSDFSSCTEVDVLQLIRDQIFHTGIHLNYIYDQNGSQVNDIGQLASDSIIFVKRDPGFSISTAETQFIIRSLDRC